MQDERAIEGGRAHPAPDKPRPSPIKVFIALLVAIAAIAAFALLTRRQEPAPTPTTPAAPADYSLTDAEAITRFKELNSLFAKAYRQRDVDLIAQFLTKDSPVRRTAFKEIQSLIHQDVLDRTTFESSGTAVLVNDSARIKISQTEIVRPRFVSETGTNVTTGGRPERQEVEYLLILQDDTWLLHQINVVASQPLESK